jgi:hypothetical protein
VTHTPRAGGFVHADYRTPKPEKSRGIWLGYLNHPRNCPELWTNSVRVYRGRERQNVLNPRGLKPISRIAEKNEKRCDERLTGVGAKSITRALAARAAGS